MGYPKVHKDNFRKAEFVPRPIANCCGSKSEFPFSINSLTAARRWREIEQASRRIQ
jgi:hypothetical protein